MREPRYFLLDRHRPQRGKVQDLQDLLLHQRLPEGECLSEVAELRPLLHFRGTKYQAATENQHFLPLHLRTPPHPLRRLTLGQSKPALSPLRER